MITLEDLFHCNKSKIPEKNAYLLTFIKKNNIHVLQGEKISTIRGKIRTPLAGENTHNRWKKAGVQSDLKIAIGLPLSMGSEA